MSRELHLITYSKLSLYNYRGLVSNVSKQSGLSFENMAPNSNHRGKNFKDDYLVQAHCTKDPSSFLGLNTSSKPSSFCMELSSFAYNISSLAFFYFIFQYIINQDHIEGFH
jgi:hypothetical protein